MKLIQRTLVITCGEAAGEAGSRLEDQLDSEKLAVAVIRLAETEWRDALPLVEAGVRRISQTTALAQLRRQGWQLDRLNELALYFLIDLSTVQGVFDAQALVRQIADLVQQQLGLETATLLLALAPDGAVQQARSRLSQLAGPLHPFNRGVLALSLVNEAGLQLATPSLLAAQAAQLLQALITTPLRDAPEWLDERNGHTGLDGAVISSAGLAVWEWSPVQEQVHLARLWVRSVLAQWLAPAETSAGEARNVAHAWMENHNFAPGSLAEAAGKLVTPVFTPTWVYPQPWQIKTPFEKLQRLSTTIDAGHAGAVAVVNQAFLPYLEEVEQALRLQCRRLLDETPVAGIARGQLFLQAIARVTAEFSERFVERQEEQQQQVAALASAQQHLTQNLETLLAQWPETGWRSWFQHLVRPWRWLELAQCYWQLQILGQEMTRLVERQAWLEQQRVITAAGEEAYRQLQESVAHLAGLVEEVGDMLAHARRLLDEEDDGEPAPSYLEPVYHLLLDAPAIEATRAAAAIGGLGRHITALDDDILPSLLEAGRARLQHVAGLSATDVVATLYPSAPEIAQWWQQLWQEAAPLWRYDEAGLPERQRAQPLELTLVCGANLALLEQRLALPEGPRRRWLETPDRHRLIVIRLRGGIPVSAPAK